MVAAASTVAVVLCTPPFGLANASTRGVPSLRRMIATARSVSCSGLAWRHSIRAGAGEVGAGAAGGSTAAEPTEAAAR